MNSRRFFRRPILLLSTAAAISALTAAVGLASSVTPVAAAASTTVSVAPGQGKPVSLGGAVSDHPAAAFSLAAMPKSPGSTYVGVRARVAGSGYYLLQANVLSTGAITATIKRRSNSGAIINLVGPKTVGFTAAAASPLVADLTVSGSSTVSLKGVIRNAAGKQYAISATDSSSARLTKAAVADAWVYASGKSTSSAKVSVTKPTAAVTAPPSTTGSVGVPAGTKLKVHEGDLVINKPNTVVSGLDIRGFVRVNAPGVVIENSVITGRATKSAVAIVSNFNNHNPFTILDSEIYARSASPYLNGIMGDHFTATRVHVHNVVDAIRITGSNVSVTGSVLEKNLHYLVDPTQGNTPSHDDSIQIQGGSDIRITGNRISGAFNAAVQVTEGLGKVSRLTIANNRLDGGGCTVNIYAAPGSTGIKESVVRDNKFGSNQRVKKCAVVASLNSVPQMTSNVWESTGASVAVHRGK